MGTQQSRTRRMSSARVRKGRRHDHRLHPYRDDQ
ncbi:hypothetical protein GBA97_02535 [Bifidobacterium longum]|nr:hypothetical protein GBA97_02535 [Bifidobacterium longum]